MVERQLQPLLPIVPAAVTANVNIVWGLDLAPALHEALCTYSTVIFF
jgi:hypothetical protein